MRERRKYWGKICRIITGKVLDWNKKLGNAKLAKKEKREKERTSRKKWKCRR